MAKHKADKRLRREGGGSAGQASGKGRQAGRRPSGIGLNGRDADQNLAGAGIEEAEEGLVIWNRRRDIRLSRRPKATVSTLMPLPVLRYSF